VRTEKFLGNPGGPVQEVIGQIAAVFDIDRKSREIRGEPFVTFVSFCSVFSVSAFQCFSFSFVAAIWFAITRM